MPSYTVQPDMFRALLSPADMATICETARPDPRVPCSAGDAVLTNGKYKHHTFSSVRQRHPEYLGWLLAQPAGAIYSYLPFVTYCLEYVTAEDCE